MISCMYVFTVCTECVVQLCSDRFSVTNDGKERNTMGDVRFSVWKVQEERMQNVRERWRWGGKAEMKGALGCRGFFPRGIEACLMSVVQPTSAVYYPASLLLSELGSGLQ